MSGSRRASWCGEADGHVVVVRLVQRQGVLVVAVVEAGQECNDCSPGRRRRWRWWMPESVFLPESAQWLDEFQAEVVSFPVAAHDDQVDVLSYACGELAKRTVSPQHIRKDASTLEERCWAQLERRARGEQPTPSGESGICEQERAMTKKAESTEKDVDTGSGRIKAANSSDVYEPPQDGDPNPNAFMDPDADPEGHLARSAQGVGSQSRSRCRGRRIIFQPVIRAIRAANARFGAGRGLVQAMLDQQYPEGDSLTATADVLSSGDR